MGAMKRFTLSLFVIVLIAALVGCSPKGDPIDERSTVIMM